MKPNAKPDRNEMILKLARQGLTYDMIGSMFGISRQRVSILAKRAGIVRQPNKSHPSYVRGLTGREVTQARIDRLLDRAALLLEQADQLRAGL